MKRPDGWTPGAGSGANAASDLFNAAFAAKIDPASTGKAFGPKYAQVAALLAGDTPALKKLADLLVSGGLSNVGRQGSTTLDELAALADSAQTGAPELAAAAADRHKLVASLLDRLDPSGTATHDPQSLLALTTPGEYARLVADAVLTGKVADAGSYKTDAAYTAKDISRKIERNPAVDPTNYLTSLQWLDARIPAGEERDFATIKQAVANDPAAETALNVLAVTGRFMDEKGQGPLAIKTLALLANPDQPLAAGIDRADLISEILRDVATPSAITQGQWQTCTAATGQRMLAEKNIGRYVLLAGVLATPDGIARVAGDASFGLKRPDDWNASAPGDGRTTLGRLFQSSLMHFAVQKQNADDLAANGQGIPPGGTDTYSNVRDEWTDADGTVRKGLPPNSISTVMSALEGTQQKSVAVPPAWTSLLTPESAQTFFNNFQKVTGRNFALPVTLNLTWPPDHQQLHEVMLTAVGGGPPPMATIVDPLDGRSKQITVPDFVKALRSFSAEQDDLQTALASMLDNQVTGIMPALLAGLGSKGGDAQTLAVSTLLSAFMGSPSSTAGTSAVSGGRRGAVRQDAGGGDEAPATEDSGGGRRGAARQDAGGGADTPATQYAGGGRRGAARQDAGGGAGTPALEDAGGGRRGVARQDAGGGADGPATEDAGGGRRGAARQDAGGGLLGGANEFAD